MLTIITGPMFYEKTTTLLGIIHKYKIAKKKILVINHETDNRYNSDNVITSHNNIKHEAMKIHDLLMIESVDEFEAIFIDEGQFFYNLILFVKNCLEKNKKVYVAGLNGDFNQNPIGDMQKLIAYASKIILLSSICNSCGEEAQYSHFIGQSSSNIVVGGKDVYEARCFSCLHKDKTMV
jgi:thymidine kinase